MVYRHEPVIDVSPSPGPEARRTRTPEWLRQSLQIFGLAGLAFAQPLLALFGESPTYFVAHGARPLDIVLFTVVVILLPAVAFIFPVLLIRLISRRAGDIAAAIAIGVLGTLVLLGAVDGLNTIRIRYWLGIFVAGTALVAWSYRRLRAVRLFATYLSFAPVLFAAMFLFTSSVRPLVFADDPDALAVSPTRTPVVFIVFDELPLGVLLRPDGSIDSDRFPGFADLGAYSTWYPNARTIAGQTHLAVPALLTGRHPNPEVPPVAGQYPRSLFTMLGGSRDLNVGEVMTSLCPQQLCENEAERSAVSSGSLVRDTGIVAGHEFLPANLAKRWFPEISATWTNFGDQLAPAPLPSDDLNTELGAWFTDARSNLATRDPDAATFAALLTSLSGQESGLWYQHLMLPHLPHQYLPDGRTYNAPWPPRWDDERWWAVDEFSVVNEQQRLLLQTQYVDTFVSALLDHLRDQDMLDDTLLVVTADHGIALIPGMHFRAFDMGAVEASSLNVDAYDAVVPVPLFVKYPGQTSAAVDDRAAQIIDVVPTIVDVLNLSLPADWDFDGHSLLADTPSSSVTRVLLGDETVELTSPPDPVRYSRYLTQMVGPYRGTHDIYAAGPYGEKVGAPLGLLGPPVEGATIAIQDPHQYEDVDRDVVPIPAYVTGNATGLASGSWIAVAIGDTVAGVGPVYLDPGGQAVLDVVMDPTLMQDGANPLSLYLVDATTLALRPVARG